jgi:hypothetical protein
MSSARVESLTRQLADAIEDDRNDEAGKLFGKAIVDAATDRTKISFTEDDDQEEDDQ